MTTNKQPRPEPMKAMCKTCPWRKGSPYAALKEYLSEASEYEGRVCHSTGATSGIHGDTGKPERICRGSRDEQLKAFHACAFLSAPTDAAWEEKCREYGL